MRARTTGRAARRLLALAALLAPAALLPATASAEHWVSYQVTVEGEGVYAYDLTTPDGSVHHRAHWTWRTELPLLTFQGERPLTDSAGAVSTATLLSAESTRTGPGDVSQCTPVGVSLVTPGSFLADDGIPTPEPTIGIRTLGGLLLDFDWCPDQAATGFDLLGQLVDGRHTYDTWFSIPREAIGMGRIIQLVHEDVTDRRCPDNLAGGADCRLTFDATVTLDKINEFDLPDGPPPEITPDDIPLPPGPPGPPAPAPAPLAPDGVVLRVAGAGLGGSAAKVALVVNCPGDCRGTVTATLPGRRGARARALARRRFTARAGRSHRVVVRFSRSARRRIRRAGGVTLRVRTVTAGKKDTRVVTVQLEGGPKGGPRPLPSMRG